MMVDNRCLLWYNTWVREHLQSTYTQPVEGIMTKLNKPGESAPNKGEYIEKGPRGGNVPSGNVVDIGKKGTTLPPTQEPGRKWEKAGK